MEQTAVKQVAPVEEAVHVAKKVKKRWIDIIAPQEFEHAFLGETYVDEPEKVVGKVVQVNLMNLTHDPKKQSMVVSFSVINVKNNQANAVLTGFEIPAAHVKRMTKRSKAKVEDSCVYTGADKVKVQIKVILMTKTKTQKSKLTLMRMESRKFFNEAVKKDSFNEVMKNVVSGSLQRDMKAVIKKYHSLSGAFIRVAKRVPNQ